MITGSRGICRLTLAPVRGEAADSSEQVTQLLFGEHYQILEISPNEKWYRIRIYHDGYEGWLDYKQHTPITDQYYDQIGKSNYKVSLEPVATILYRKKALNILIGSVLPITTHELFRIEEKLAFSGESKALGERTGPGFLLQVAQKYLNAPYMWGGRTPFGIDCSGFTQIVFRICGYSLLRDASQQATQGSPVLQKVAEPGDIALFVNEQGKIYHVGILMEDDQIIHASGNVRIDELDEKGIYLSDSGKYTHKLAFMRRIIKK
jgi:cell wall-associated NlpC family hydrolase